MPQRTCPTEIHGGPRKSSSDLTIRTADGQDTSTHAFVQVIEVTADDLARPSLKHKPNASSCLYDRLLHLYEAHHHHATHQSRLKIQMPTSIANSTPRRITR